MEDPVRLVCPHCELVYRLKRRIPGKTYKCKNCGEPLAEAETAHDEGESGFDKAIAASSASGRAFPGGKSPESALTRLPRLIEELTARLDVLKDLELGEETTGPAARILKATERLENELGDINADLDRKIADLDGKMSGFIGDGLREMREGVTARLGALEERLAEILNRTPDSGDLTALRQEFRDELTLRLAALEETLGQMLGATVDSLGFDALRRELRDGRGDLLAEFLSRLEQHRESQKQELNALLTPVAEEARTNTTVEVDIDELADRLVAGVRVHSPLFDTDSGTVIDAVAKLADELVNEQRSNTSRLDKLAEEIRNAVAGIAMLEEWRGGLPARVADEIGQSVETRVVGPISTALARQAPAILSELQDSKLVDIVSRSVREAQRPLLREILAGGRSGIPLSLFAAIVLPLLLVLGYLLLLPPDGFTITDVIGTQQDMADNLTRLESVGLPLSPEDEERLRNIEKVLDDIHGKAMTHAMNAAGLAEQVNSLTARIEGQNMTIKEYEKMVQTQTRKLRLYEMKLMQLGVSPSSVAE